MKHSESIQSLAKAMSGLQSEIRDAEKDTQGYGYKYADLYQVLSLIRPLLAKHGLAFTQHVSNADDKVLIETMVMHESGEWMASEISMPPTPNTKMSAAQSVGSAITYGRRYSLVAIFGITQCTEDDDGANYKHRKTAEEPKPHLISQHQEMELDNLLSQSKANTENFLKSYKIDNLSQMTIAAYEDAKKKLNNKIQQMNRSAGVEYLGV